MLSLSRIKASIKEKLKNRRGFGTTLLAVPLIIGFGMPILGAGWDINNMRIYKVDMQNVVDMGLLSVMAHADNTFRGEDAITQIKSVISCNLHPKNNNAPSLPKGTSVCATYTSDLTGTKKIEWYGDKTSVTGSGSNRRAAVSGEAVDGPPYRPGLSVTDVNIEGTIGRVAGQLSFKYKPMFLPIKETNTITTDKSSVQAKYLCEPGQPCSQGSSPKGTQGTNQPKPDTCTPGVDC